MRLDAEALAMRDIDLMWDTGKRIIFATQLARVDRSMLGVLKKVDASFRMRQSQQYTAANKDGFEVDIIRREQTDGDPHPIKLSDEDEDFWVVQACRRKGRARPARLEALTLACARRSLARAPISGYRQKPITPLSIATNRLKALALRGFLFEVERKIETRAKIGRCATGRRQAGLPNFDPTPIFLRAQAGLSAAIPRQARPKTPAAPPASGCAAGRGARARCWAYLR